MGDLAEQLAAKFHTPVPAESRESAAESGRVSATSGSEKPGPQPRSEDPRAQTDPALARFSALVSEVTGIEATEVSREKSLREDLGVDSLSLVEITVRAEERFGVRLERRTVAGFATIGDAVDYLSAHQEA